MRIKRVASCNTISSAVEVIQALVIVVDYASILNYYQVPRATLEPQHDRFKFHMMTAVNSTVVASLVFKAVCQALLAYVARGDIFPSTADS